MTVTRETVRLANRSRRRTGTEADRAARAIERSWAAGWRTLERAWTRAAASITTTADGQWPRPWVLARNPDLRDALTATEVTLTDQQHRTRAAVVAAVAAVVPPALIAEATILATQWAATARDGLVDLFTRNLRPRLADLVTATAATRAASAVAPLATDTYRQVERVVTRGVPHRDPTRAADRLVAAVRAAFTGGANRAVTAVRTETLDAHRDAAAAFRGANLQTVTGWVWVSALSRATCPACWVMHDTIHPAADPGPHGHPGCRCIPLPLRDSTNAGAVPDARAVFDALPREDQIAILGVRRHQLLRTGAVDWVDLAVWRPNRNWRPSYQPRRVADLERIARTRT